MPPRVILPPYRPKPDLPVWLTVMAAAAHASVSRRTIYNWIAAGKLAYIRTAGGSIRIDAASLFREDLD